MNYMCPKIKPKFEKLTGAWPIRRLNPFMPGPARIIDLFQGLIDRDVGTYFRR